MGRHSHQVIYSRRNLEKPKVFRQFNDRVVDWLEDDPDYILMQYSKAAYEPYPEAFFVGVDKFLMDVMGPSEYAAK